MKNGSSIRGRKVSFVMIAGLDTYFGGLKKNGESQDSSIPKAIVNQRSPEAGGRCPGTGATREKKGDHQAHQVAMLRHTGKRVTVQEKNVQHHPILPCS